MFRIAVRNLLRNRRRSLLTLFSVALGLGSLIFLDSFVNGAQRQMSRNVVSLLTNEAQIVPPSLENILNTNGFIEDPESVRQVLRQDRRVVAFSEQIITSGTVSSPVGLMMTYVAGLNSREELAIGSELRLVGGRILEEDEEHAILIGRKMGEVLQVGVGEKVVLTVQPLEGELAGEAFTVVGFYETGNNQIDSGTAFIARPVARRLLRFGQRISKFCLKIDPRFPLEEVVRDLQVSMAGLGLSVLTWEEMIPLIAQMIRLQDLIVMVILFIILVIVTAGILNTLLMSIVERTREFGLLMALGARPVSVVGLVLTEAVLLSLLGSLCGIALGTVLSLFWGNVGINLTHFMETFTNFLVGSHVYPALDPGSLVLFPLIVLVSNGLVSLYPSWRASRMEPVEAMREI